MPVLPNARHELFVQNLAAGKGVTEAYVLAGFKRHSGSASRLRRNAAIDARLREILAAASARTEITVARVLEELGNIAFANFLDYMRVAEDGMLTVDFSALSRERAAALTEVTIEEFKSGRGEAARDGQRIKFKIADKRGALADIGKHLGMFRERVEHMGKDESAVETVTLTELEAARRIAFTLAKAKQQLTQRTNENDT